MKLLGKSAIITGASSGLGAAWARELAQAGVTVTLFARRKPLLEEVAHEIQSTGGAAYVCAGDIQNEADIKHLVNTAVSSSGRIDILLNNAGMLGSRLPFDAYPTTHFQTTLMVNVVGTFCVTRAALPHLRKSPEALVLNVSSYLGRHGLPNCAGYIASKFGVEGLTQALAEEVRDTPIVVVSLSPGMVATDMLAEYLGSPADDARSPQDAAQILTRMLATLGPEHHGQQLDIDDWS
ncbi:MAG: SDR family oxidoreductase [Myxococcales bacterium]|nr:SDR family oxidoreductase [Myxococcales bacterium]